MILKFFCNVIAFVLPLLQFVEVISLQFFLSMMNGLKLWDTGKYLLCGGKMD